MLFVEVQTDVHAHETNKFKFRSFIRANTVMRATELGVLNT